MTRTAKIPKSPNAPDAPSTVSVPTWKRWLKRMTPKWWHDEAKTTKGNIVTSAFVVSVVLSVAGWQLVGQIQAVSAKQLADVAAQAKHDTAAQQFIGDSVEHARQVTEYAVCLSDAADRVTRSDGLRTVLKAITDLSDVAPDSAGAAAFSESRAALIDAAFPPLDITELENDCVKPGPSPTPPPSP